MAPAECIRDLLSGGGFNEKTVTAGGSGVGDYCCIGTANAQMNEESMMKRKRRTKKKVGN